MLSSIKNKGKKLKKKEKTKLNVAFNKINLSTTLSNADFSTQACVALRITDETAKQNQYTRFHAIGSTLSGGCTADDMDEREKVSQESEEKDVPDKTAKKKKKTPLTDAQKQKMKDEKKARKWLLNKCRLPFFDLLEMINAEVVVTSSPPTTQSTGTFVISFSNEEHYQKLHELYDERLAWSIPFEGVDRIQAPRIFENIAVFLKAQNAATNLLSDWYRYFFFPVIIMVHYKRMCAADKVTEKCDELEAALAGWIDNNTTHYVCSVFIQPGTNWDGPEETTIEYIDDQEKNAQCCTNYRAAYDSEDPTKEMQQVVVINAQ